MNILHISSAKSWRGGERQVFYLVDGLVGSGNQSYLMSPENSALASRCSGICKGIFDFKNGLLGQVANLQLLKKICKSEKIDIIHGHDSHAHTLIWLAYKTGVVKTKSVVTRRLNNPIKDKSQGKYNYYKIVKIICISDAVRITLLPKIEDESRLVTIHSAIDLADVSEPKTLKVNGDIVIGYVAAFTQEKDHSFFIDCALELLKLNERFKFLLIGDGPLKKKIENRVMTSNRFEFTGFVEDVNIQYARLDILLHTASSEALGTAILDGMKFGLPVVARDVGGISEVVSNGKNGYLVKEKKREQVVESVMDMCRDKGLYLEMSTNSLKLVKRFDRSEMVKKTLDLYQDVLAAK